MNITIDSTLHAEFIFNISQAEAEAHLIRHGRLPQQSAATRYEKIA